MVGKNYRSVSVSMQKGVEKRGWRSEAMTPEQRKLMEFYAKRARTHLAIAVRAALAEIDALRADRERIENLELWAEMPDECSGKRWSWGRSDDEYDTLREAIDARAAKEKAWVGESCQS